MPSLGTLRVNKGFVGLAAIDFGEDVSQASMTVRVYLVPPVKGQGGTPLFPEQAMVTLSTPPPGSSSPASFFQALQLEANETAVPSPGLYGEIDVLYPDGTNLAQQFTLAIDGK